jgi:superfamily II DNA helicase RecQ
MRRTASTSGEEFCPIYKKLHRLRDFTGHWQEVPFVACTATVPCTTHTFNVIWNSLAFGHRPFWGLAAGCDRNNLFYLTRTLQNVSNSILDVLNILPANLEETSDRSLIPNVLTYYDSVAGTRAAKETWRR